MVTFISIERSEPKILTWTLHHHSPSYLAILFCLREKLARQVPLLVISAEQDSTTIVFRWFSPSVKFFSAITGLPRSALKNSFSHQLPGVWLTRLYRDTKILVFNF